MNEVHWRRIVSQKVGPLRSRLRGERNTEVAVVGKRKNGSSLFVGVGRMREVNEERRGKWRNRKRGQQKIQYEHNTIVREHVETGCRSYRYPCGRILRKRRSGIVDGIREAVFFF